MASKIYTGGCTRTRSARARNQDSEAPAITRAANNRKGGGGTITRGTEAEAETTKKPVGKKPHDTGGG